MESEENVVLFVATDEQPYKTVNIVLKERV
jgi:hypothetical protein